MASQSSALILAVQPITEPNHILFLVNSYHLAVDLLPGIRDRGRGGGHLGPPLGSFCMTLVSELLRVAR